MFGAILTKTLDFIVRYQRQSALEHQYLNNCVIVFMAGLLELCTRNVDGQEAEPRLPLINSEVYLRMKEHLRAGISDEEFLLNCLTIGKICVASLIYFAKFKWVLPYIGLCCLSWFVLSYPKYRGRHNFIKIESE